MQTINELSQELGLTPAQSAKIHEYFIGLIVELLSGIRDENDRNFDETIQSLRDQAVESPRG